VGKQMREPIGRLGNSTLTATGVAVMAAEIAHLTSDF